MGEGDVFGFHGRKRDGLLFLGGPADRAFSELEEIARDRAAVGGIGGPISVAESGDVGNRPGASQALARGLKSIKRIGACQALARIKILSQESGSISQDRPKTPNS